MTTTRLRALLAAILLAALPATPRAQRRPSAAPQIDIEHTVVDARLEPESHELKATATLTFRVVEATQIVLLQVSENLSVQKVTGPDGTKVEFGQDETGPGTLSLRFARELPSGSRTTVKIEYGGGFDRDRYSRLFSRDEASAYVGPEGSYLLYASRWTPTNKFLVDRSTAEIRVTVPLGMTVVGPGSQLPVVTEGIVEKFGWSAKSPILPHSIVAGRFFEKKVKSGDVTIDCFAREDHVAAIQKSADALGKIVQFYSQRFGPPAAGKNLRLVEVDDRLAGQHGALGMVFVTHRELSQPTPAVRQLARRAAYQWWMETVGVSSREDAWLIEGPSYLSAALYLGTTGGPNAMLEEIANLSVLALKFESKSAVRVGLGLGYRTEAYESVVGGKGAWVLNMLRQLVGDAKFQQLLRDYARQFAAAPGSTTAFQKLAEKIYGKDLAWFFAEWIDTIGVPEFQVDYVVYKGADGFRVSGTVKQDRDLFRMPLEIAVATKGKRDKAVVELSGKTTAFDVKTFALPKQVIVDPDNKILRNSREMQTSVQLSLGNDLKDRGQLVDAVRAYEEALKLNAHKSLAHFRLAEVFYEQFNLQSAANSFRDALNGDKDPAWIEVWAYIYLGKIYDILGQRQRAMAEYNKAVNTKDDTNGAQAEAKKWIQAPFTRERTVMEKESREAKD
jgi:aminopeptidase N